MRTKGLFVLCLLWITGQVMRAQQDYTNRLGGAFFTDGSYWHLEGEERDTLEMGDGYNVHLQLDTWSGRGGSDGSNMTVPFMEYFRNKGSHNLYYPYCMLPDAKIRHTTVEGLPAGRYRLSMLVRCYAETYNYLYPPKGVTLYANGVETEDFIEGLPLTDYGGGAYALATPTITFEVGSDGKLDFGLNVTGAQYTEMNWVAWKNVELLYLDGDETDDDMTDGETMAEGEYYLRNKETGSYLQAGGKWGTQAVLGEHGSLVIVNKISDGIYALETEFANGDYKHYLGVDDTFVYMEVAQQGWVFHSVGDGSFTIYQKGYGYLGTEDYETVSPFLTDAASPAAHWELVSYSKRKEGLLNGTETDATFLVSNPRFDKNFNNSLWEGVYGLGGHENMTGNQVAEVWKNAIDVKQTLINIPNGRYQITMQGYYRYHSTNESAKEAHEDGTEKLLAEFYAQSGNTEESKPIQSIASEEALLDALPGNKSMAGNYFANGYYSDNKLIIDVKNNALSIGIRKPDPENGYEDWTCWDNIELTLLEVGYSTLEKGEYYLRNKETGSYLQAGGKWGTQAVLGTHGSLIKAAKVSDDMFTLETEFANGTLHHLGAVDEGIAYMDLGPQIWIIVPVGDGSFTIYQEDFGYLGTVDNETVYPYLTDQTSKAAQWEFISYRSKVEGLLAGTEQDATFLISDPRFDRGFSNSLWEGYYSLGGVNNWSGYGNQVAEVWGGNSATIDVSQTLTNIPNGCYQITMQGYYRYNDTSNNDNDRAKETHQDGTEKLYAKLFAKSGDTEKTTPIQSIASEEALLYDLPNGMETAGNYFRNGYYSDNKLTIDVTNNMLSIGVKKTECDGTDWTCWDNFELTLLAVGDNSDYKFEDETQTDIDFSKASPDHPVDCTTLIKNADLNGAALGWNGSLKRTSSGTNRIAEYGGTGNSYTTFDIYQQLTEVPNGIYRLSVKGFYRYGDVKTEEHDSYGGNNENSNNNVWATYTIPYATISRRIGHESLLAKLYANNMEVGLPSIFDGAKQNETYDGEFETEFGWVPDATAAAVSAFEAGDYGVELLVPVVDGELRLGVKKQLGYKYDWTCFDDFKLEYLGTQDLVYATNVNTETSSINIAEGETRQLTASIVPTNASDTKLEWWSSDENIMTCSSDGIVKGVNAGYATLYVRALGSERGSMIKTMDVTVSPANGDPSQLVFNEIQVSNLDMFIDPSNNYGGYVEFYNIGSSAVSLHNLYLTDDESEPYKFRLNSLTGSVPAKGHAVIWFDHNEGESGNYTGNANFQLDMDGGSIYLYDANGNQILSQTYPFAVSRTSYARKTDGTGEWGVTAYPTPGKSNKDSKEFLYEGAPRVPAPTATPGTGFYTLKNLAISVQGEGAIYCTLDGTLPSETNGVTPDKLPTINGATVLKLRAFESGKLPSEVVTYTYAEDKYNHTLPVLMVSADPRDLYSDELGVFVTGTNGTSGSGIDYPCNWNRDWDRAAQMELLDKDGTSLFQQDVNLSRFGGWSRSWFPYNFKLKAQKQHEGKNYLEYPFFERNKPYLKHKVLQVRNGGNDVSCRIKDASLHHIILSSGFYLDCLDYQPVHCYVNGQYCGMQNLREPSNKHYGLADYGIDTDEMDAFEFTGSVNVQAGTREAFDRWRELSYYAYDDDVYRQICDLVDVDEFANYFAAEIYLGGDDWPGNNCKGFKGNDGKFHIVFFDVDQALRFDIGAFNRLSSVPLVSVFRNMVQYNETFRKKFIDSFCIFGGSVMQVQRCHDIIDQMSAEMNPALALEGLSTSPTADYMKSVLTEARRETMITALRNWWYADLYDTRAYRVKFSSNINDAKLQVNGIDVPMAQFDGTLFAPSILTAAAPEGYVFKGWKSSDGEWLSKNEKFDLAALSSTEALDSPLEMQAVYEQLTSDEALKADIAMPVKVNEISAGNTIFAAETWKRSDWIELYNMTDQPLDVTGLYLSDNIDQPLKFQIVKNSSVTNTIIPANGHLIVWADDLGTQDGQKQLHTSFKLSNSNDQHVVVVSSSQFVQNNPSYFEQHPNMTAFIDVLTYNAHRGDETVGRYPDGGKTFYRMGRPTIERTNTLLSGDEKTGEDESFMSILLNEFTLELSTGWNWASHCLAEPIKPTKLSNYTESIVGKSAEVHRNGTSLTGTLKSLDAGNLYKVQMSQADTYYSLSDHCDAALPISLTTGWNWIGYTAMGVQTVAEALADYQAEEGDKLVGQDGFAIYTDGQWKGSLSSIETGKGYLLYAQKEKTLKFRSPEMAINLRRARLKGLAERSYGVDKYAYPNVMGVIGTLQQDGSPVSSDQYTLLAYVDGECRGAGKWYDQSIFLTTYGQGNETIQYFALNELDGKLYPVQEKLAFADDVKGTLKSPVVFNIGEPDSDDETGIDDNVYAFSPHTTVVGYYSLSGQMMGNSDAKLQKGIYIVKYKDGSFRKMYVHPNGQN